MKNLKGKFIVIDGTDGSGKTTQVSLLKDYLINQGLEVEVLDFPQYDKPWGKMVARYLSGEFGEIDDVNPYIAQPYYMLDQASKADDIKKWLSEGKIVLSNRYITSSMIHQASKFELVEDQNKFLDWLEEYGYGELGVVKENLLIFLHVPTEISFQLANNTESRNRKSKHGMQNDIAEKNYKHQKDSCNMALRLCEEKDHWVKIECVEEGNLLEISEIHSKLINTLVEY